MAAREPYVALLRAINVGGKRVVPMKQLAEIFTALGCSDVQTYIQSGNVVFRATADAARKLPVLASRRIEERFGFPVPVIVRDRKAMERVVRENPFLKPGVLETALHVYFLADVPSASAVKGLDPNRSSPDAFHVTGQHIYLHVPNGMGRSKLTCAYFDSKLATVSSARNWATVNKLLEMMQE
jgi:uncharacterized protein (DUF1697 family)